MRHIFVGIGDIATSDIPGDIVKTMALGSCVAVIISIRKLKVVGMTHSALPDSKIYSRHTEKMPGYFVDKAIPNLIQQFKKWNGFLFNDMDVKLVGGAAVMGDDGAFNIGTRNVMAARKILSQYQFLSFKQDVGDTFSRTVGVEVDTGRVTVSSPHLGKWEV